MRPDETDETEGTSPRSYGFEQRIAPAFKNIVRYDFFDLPRSGKPSCVATCESAPNKLRTALTLVGIVVGVAAVIAVVTIIKGLDKTVAQTFSSQGSTVFTISKKPQIIRSREEFIQVQQTKRRDARRRRSDRSAVQRLLARGRRGECGRDRQVRGSEIRERSRSRRDADHDV